MALMLAVPVVGRRVDPEAAILEVVEIATGRAPRSHRHRRPRLGEELL